MEKKILHILEVSQFLNFTVERFEEVFPEQNFFLVNKEIHLHGKNEKHLNRSNIKYYAYGSEDYKNILNTAHDYFFLLIFHNIGPPYKFEIAKYMSGKIPMHGILWGFEIYNNKKLFRKIYLPNTRNYLKQRQEFKNRHQSIRGVLDQVLKPNSYWNRHWKTFDYLSSYSTILESERELVSKFYRSKKKYFPFNYSGGYKVEEKIGIRRGTSILVGNSASISNNHLDVLKFLQQVNLTNNSKIVLPLSYGDEEYADFIERSYKQVFCDKVIPLRKFMPLEEYKDTISSCSFVIMNHIRQQAMGNIFLSLLEGAKVFLNKKSFGYKELSSSELKIYFIEEFEKEYPINENPNNITHNQLIIKNLRGEKTSKENVERIINYYNDYISQ